MSRSALSEFAITRVQQDNRNGRIYVAFGIGMAINLVAIYVGNPYLMTLLILPVALITTVQWLQQPLPWITLTSVVAANPVNLEATVAFNLIFAFFLLIFNVSNFNRLPHWLYLVLTFASISVAGSAVSWGENGGLFTQLAAVFNYVLGPFLLIPLIYFRLQKESDTGTLLKIMVLALIVPTVTLMLLARSFGTPILDANALRFDYLVDISIYHLGNVRFQLTRTQAGIPLAVLICASFAVVISDINRYLRLLSLAALIIYVFFLLVTGSLGSSLSALCGLALILFFAARYIPIKKYLILIPFLAALVMVGWSLVPRGIKDYAESRIEQKLTSGVDVSDRSFRWQASLNYLLENPLGQGWNLYITPLGTYPHNDYLSYGIAFGIVCGLLYLFVPIKIIYSLISAKLHSENHLQVALFLIGIGCTSVFLVNSLSDHLTANRWYFNVVWSMIWFIYFAVKSNNNTAQIDKT